MCLPKCLLLEGLLVNEKQTQLQMSVGACCLHKLVYFQQWIIASEIQVKVILDFCMWG